MTRVDCELCERGFKLGASLFWFFLAGTTWRSSLSINALCQPMFIFTSSSSALLGYPCCGLLIWLSLLGIFNTLFWVYDNSISWANGQNTKWTNAMEEARRSRTWLQLLTIRGLAESFRKLFHVFPDSCSVSFGNSCYVARKRTKMPVNSCCICAKHWYSERASLVAGTLCGSYHVLKVLSVLLCGWNLMYWFSFFTEMTLKSLALLWILSVISCQPIHNFSKVWTYE